MEQIRVPDMMCNGCAEKIKDAVKKLAGVVSVEADPQSKRVRIEGGPSRPDLVTAIRHAGFNPE